MALYNNNFSCISCWASAPWRLPHNNLPWVFLLLTEHCILRSRFPDNAWSVSSAAETCWQYSCLFWTLGWSWSLDHFEHAAEEWIVKTHLDSRLRSRMTVMTHLARFRAPMLMAMLDMMVMDHISMCMGTGTGTGLESCWGDWSCEWSRRSRV